MITPEEITPIAPAAAAPVEPEAAPVAAEEEDTADEIPEEVLALPVFNGLLKGQPAAVFASEADNDPGIDAVLKNFDALVKAGFGFYRALDDRTNVFFNEQHISAEEIKKADQEGKLADVAVPFAELNQSYSEVLAGAKGGAAAPAAAAAAPPPSAGGAPAAGLDQKLATRRLKNMAIGPPSAGPAPGQGRLLNSILQPAV